MTLDMIVYKVAEYYCQDGKCLIVLRNDSKIDESLDHVMLDREYLLVPSSELKKVMDSPGRNVVCTVDATCVIEKGGYGGNTSWHDLQEEHRAIVTLKNLKGQFSVSIDEMHD